MLIAIHDQLEKMGRHPLPRPLYISVHPSPISPQIRGIFPSSSCRHNGSILLVFLHHSLVQLHKKRTILMEMLEPKNKWLLTISAKQENSTKWAYVFKMESAPSKIYRLILQWYQKHSILLVFLHHSSVQLHKRRTVLMEMLEPKNKWLLLAISAKQENSSKWAYLFKMEFAPSKIYRLISTMVSKALCTISIARYCQILSFSKASTK